MTTEPAKLFNYPEVGVPFFWPLGIATQLTEATLKLTHKNLEFLREVEETQIERPKPVWATQNTTELSLHTLNLRNFSQSADGIPTLVLPPYAGHTSQIADFYQGQSLVEALLSHGIPRVYVTEWLSATDSMKDYDIDNYLAELNVCVADLGGKVNLIGLCQGGWIATMYAARYPRNIQTLTLAGAPIDTDAGSGPIKDNAHEYPLSFFEGLVKVGGGLLQGKFMLQGFKNMHPEKQYVDKFTELYAHIDEPHYVQRFERFESWYENTVNLPGRWYLQAIKELFKENRLAKGEFVGLGKRLSLQAIDCPVYLLAGDRDDITPKEQVFNAGKYLGTGKDDIIKDLAEGGHIGLFMGKKAIDNNWSKIAAWILAH